ncbi:MAG: flagellar FlbD family protein [Chloroflexota bacterium]
MIYVTRLNGKKFYINAELVQLVESTPDTVITLINGAKYIVKDSAEEIVQRILEYHQTVSGSKDKIMEARTSEETGA